MSANRPGRAPELTLKAILLGVVLSALLSAANAYLGLFAGLTVSASIPAAVISMALLRVLGGTIFENNIVQTAASAGESLAAGVIFTIPAMVLLGAWNDFNYVETTIIAGFGGVLGVLFTIPLRRAFIIEADLDFPEGKATAEVLKVGNEGGSGVVHIVGAGLIGAGFKLGEAGLRLWAPVLEGATYMGRTVGYVGGNLSPALLGVGYIVGLNVAVLLFIGGALNWFIAIPIVALLMDQPEGVSALDFAKEIWSTQTRYIGVGSMVVGGLWALINLWGSLVDGVRSGLEAYRRARQAEVVEDDDPTEKEIPMQWVGVALIFSVVPLTAIFYYVTHLVGVSVFMAVVMLIAGFLFSAVAGYMAGLVGSSNNPISGVTIATILTASLLLLMLLGSQSPIGATASILIGSVVCCAASIAADNMQDLKAGRIIGATPYKQQIMQIIGVISAAVVIAPVLSLLQDAYGIGVATPEHPKPLIAPQASLMASVAKGVFEGGLPWGLIAIGMGVAVAVIVLDKWLEAQGAQFRTPVLAVAVGIYLPFELSVPILVGGLVAHFAARRVRRAARDEQLIDTASRNGLLFAAGLITGEALVGILMAIPIVLTSNPEVLAFFGVFESGFPGLLLLVGVTYLLTHTASNARAGRS